MSYDREPPAPYRFFPDGTVIPPDLTWHLEFPTIAPSVSGRFARFSEMAKPKDAEE